MFNHLPGSPSHRSYSTVLRAFFAMPHVWFIFLTLFQFSIWTIAPILVSYPPALDAIEMHSWSLVPQWGYYKHPPLPAWLVAVSTALFGKTQLALTLPSTASIAFTYWAIWQLAKEMLPRKSAVVVVFFSATTLFYHIWAVSFNHNVIQIPLWAWTITLFYKTVAGTPHRASRWLGLGAVFGFTVLAKYTAILLLPAFLLCIVLIPRYRQALTAPRLLLALLAFAVVFTPHGLWLIQHDFQPLHYASTRLAESQHGLHPWTSHWARNFGGFIGTLFLAYSIPLVLLGWRLKKTNYKTSPTQQEQQRFLLIMTFCPLACALALGLSGQMLAPMWGMAMLPMLALLLVHRYDNQAANENEPDKASATKNNRPALSQRSFIFYHRKWLSAWLIFQLLAVMAFLLKGSPAYYRLSTRSARANYPAKALSKAVVEKWQSQFPQHQLRYIAGPLWEAGVVSFYAIESPWVLPDGDFSAAPWITASEVRDCGIVLLNPTIENLQHFPTARIQTPLVLPTIPERPPITVSWALVSPVTDRCSTKPR